MEQNYQITRSPEWNVIFNLLLDPKVSEIAANGPDQFFMKRAGKRIAISNIPRMTEETYFNGIQHGLVPFVKSQNVFSRESFIFEGRLEYEVGEVEVRGRCHIVLPPASDYPQVTIAKKTTSLLSLDAIAAAGSMSDEMRKFLRMAVEANITMVISGATGAGKSVTLDTKIPTPSGWSTMGEIKVGDEVFDRFGNVVKVTHKFPQPARQVYEVEFNTGEKVYCDAEHNWLVSTQKSRKINEFDKYVSDSRLKDNPLHVVKTTDEMLQESKNIKHYGIRSFNVPILEKPVEYFDSLDIEELPIHPYVLGLWLGDGDSNSVRLTAHPDDRKEYVKIFEQLGIDSKLEPVGSNGRRWKFDIKDMQKNLQKLDIFVGKQEKGSKKSIPEIYKKSSVEARRLLLAGLMDSDGTVHKRLFIFCNSNLDLINDVREISSSLGLRTSISQEPYLKKREKTTDEYYQPIWRLYVSGGITLSMLPRKKDKYEKYIKLVENQKPRDRNRIIKSISITDRREEMACITVDGVDSTYLITESFIPTHNTTMLEALGKFIPKETRLGIAEDTPELKFDLPNTTYLNSTPWSPGMNPNEVATLDWVVAQFMRNRCDRLIIGEVRGKEFGGYLIAANSGMEGGMTTIHAETPSACLRKMTGFTSEARPGVPIRSINTDIASAVKLIVQLIILPGGKHRVSHIEEITTTLSNNDDAQISTQPLYLYDRATDSFYKEGNMSDSLREYCKIRGQDVNEFLKSETRKKVPSIGHIRTDADESNLREIGSPGIPVNNPRRLPTNPFNNSQGRRSI